MMSSYPYSLCAEELWKETVMINRAENSNSAAGNSTVTSKDMLRHREDTSKSTMAGVMHSLGKAP